MTDAESGTDLVKVAAWFAREIVGNEWSGTVRGYKFPNWFKQLVAMAMVTDPEIGWPDVAEAMAYLDDFCAWE